MTLANFYAIKLVKGTQIREGSFEKSLQNKYHEENMVSPKR